MHFLYYDTVDESLLALALSPSLSNFSFKTFTAMTNKCLHIAKAFKEFLPLCLSHTHAKWLIQMATITIIMVNDSHQSEYFVALNTDSDCRLISNYKNGMFCIICLFPSTIWQKMLTEGNTSMYSNALFHSRGGRGRARSQVLQTLKNIIKMKHSFNEQLQFTIYSSVWLN